jgi:hypothetical protein
MRPNPHAQSFGSRAGSTFKRLLVTLVVLALGGAVLFLLSQLNHRTFTLVQDGGTLQVMKGRMLPVGATPFRPTGDPRLTDAYAPVPLEGLDAGDVTHQRYSERDEMDRALFGVLERLARPRIQSDEPKQLEQGLYYLRRAALLGGLTDEQRRSLQSMQADVAYYHARHRLEEARKLVAEGLAQLKVAAESQNRNARSANQMLTRVGPAAEGLEEALRDAVHTLSEPAAPPPPAEAQGGAGPEAPKPPEAKPEAAQPEQAKPEAAQP